MKLTPWRRRDAVTPFHDDDDFFSRFFGPAGEPFASHLPELFQQRALPAVNVAETEDEFCITVDCPGLDEDDIHVQAMGSSLVVSGERKWEEEKEGKEFRRVESQYGSFERRIALPEALRIEPDDVDATYEKGVLTVVVKKREKTPAAKIKVRKG